MGEMGEIGWHDLRRWSLVGLVRLVRQVILVRKVIQVRLVSQVRLVRLVSFGETGEIGLPEKVDPSGPGEFGEMGETLVRKK